MTISGPVILLAIIFALLLTGQVIILLILRSGETKNTTKDWDSEPVVIENTEHTP
jgi:hypothetical protein